VSAPQDHAQRILPRRPFRKKVYRSIDELQADLDPWSASAMNKATSGTLVFQQNADADLP